MIFWRVLRLRVRDFVRWAEGGKLTCADVDDAGNKYVPRAVLVDLEPGTMDVIRASPCTSCSWLCMAGIVADVLQS